MPQAAESDEGSCSIEKEKGAKYMQSYFESKQALQESLISIKTKKHKSLGVLCIVFIRLFFERSFVLTIEEVVKHFADLDNNEEEKHQFIDREKETKGSKAVDLQFKSHTRRLYDIANVLVSLGIIEKVKYKQKKVVKNQKEKKNAYKWIGSKGFSLLEGSKTQDCEANSATVSQNFTDEELDKKSLIQSQICGKNDKNLDETHLINKNKFNMYQKKENPKLIKTLQRSDSPNLSTFSQTQSQSKHSLGKILGKRNRTELATAKCQTSTKKARSDEIPKVSNLDPKQLAHHSSKDIVSTHLKTLSKNNLRALICSQLSR